MTDDVSSDVMMGLGETFIFSISTVAYSNLQRSDEWRWVEQTRFGKNDALQYTGRPNPIITLAGKTHAYFMDGVGIGQIELLRQLGNNYTPLQLVTGAGEVMGYWVILTLTETQSSFLMKGAPKEQEFSLTLKYYGDRLSQEG
ncbi:phage tail protein [Leclercia adecarboxylata]|uniref:phage tail protein n=1 Tax=Leclercia adecarboxylata TaxID=83655 RepID=UPI002DBB8A97|nr:phage tail protein [Leclercia adecarboxylata]MEB5748651.1 phage tail protein [Leclercia adecarboxylata]